VVGFNINSKIYFRDASRQTLANTGYTVQNVSSVKEFEVVSNKYRMWLVLLVGHMFFKGSKTSHFIIKSYFFTKSLNDITGWVLTGQDREIPVFIPEKTF
jgi:hypothetical protein